MSGTFVHFQFLFDEFEVAEIAEGLFQHGARVEALDFTRPAGTVFELLRRVALQINSPPGLSALRIPAHLRGRSAGVLNWVKISTTTSNASGG